jgi:hypothetical protein
MAALGSLQADVGIIVFARFAVTAFFAIVFVQSSLDKIFDSQGNLSFLREHFKNAPIPDGGVVPMFWALTALELAAGVSSSLGILFGSFAMGGGMARRGLMFATLALLALLLGQRLAKDYAGAAVVAAYFAVALLGHLAFALGH